LHRLLIFFKAFIPCAAHSLQNVIKDGLNFSEGYTELIKKVSKKIVSKSKFSHLIAEELRSYRVKFNKKNTTRWNSILFMVRSVLKVTPAQFLDI